MSALAQLNLNAAVVFQPLPSSGRSRGTVALPALTTRMRFNTPTLSSFPRFASTGPNFKPRKTVRATFAGNSDRVPGEKSIQGKASGNETTAAPKGPPFLTIVAGIVVFFLVCWVVGSFALWVVSPIVNLFISK